MQPLNDHQSDVYELHHKVDATSTRNFFRGLPILSDQISREGLGVVWNELEHTLQSGIPGDVVEMGCYIGTTSLFIRRQLDAAHASEHRSFHAYDSFQGLPPKSAADQSVAGEQFKQGRLRVGKRDLLLQFKRAGLRPPIIHKGWFSDLQPDDMPPKIAFAFLDGDFYDSITDSLKLVWPKLQPGGRLLIDDYQNAALPGVERAVRSFFSNQSVRINFSHDIAVIIK